MARTLSVACLLAGSSVARADGVTATLAPGVSTSRTSRTDEAGRRTEQDVTDLVQQYTLSLDRTLYPHLVLSGTGTFLDDRSWVRQPDGTTLLADQRAGTVSTRLAFGTGLLGGALSYDRRQEAVTAAAGGRAWAVGDTSAATAGWHPLDLPTLDLRLARQDQHDPTAPGADTVSYDGLLALGYRAVKDLDLRYTLRFTRTELADATSLLVTQDARAAYHASLLDGRTSAYAGAGISSVYTQTSGAGASGALATQRFPVAGLSVIEDFPALPESDVLSPNPGLVNGDLRGAAAVDLGTAIGLSDQRPRDLGVQLADAVTKVDRIRIWVDQALPFAVSRAFTWDAYQSADGLSWTRVPIAGPVTFGTLENRFEIPILETAARFLKVVTRAIDPSVTTDGRFAHVWVTEVQVLDAQAAAAVVSGTTRRVETFSGTAQTRLHALPEVAHDVSVSVTHPSDGAPTTWMLVNGLSILHRATPTLTLSGRVAEQEADAGTGRTSMVQWSGTASHRPIPTLTEGFTYGGQRTAGLGAGLTNSASAFARAELYTGIAATGNASASLASTDRGASTRTVGATLGGSVVPNRRLSLATTYGVSSTLTSGGGRPAAELTRQRADATATYTPVPALFASAGLTRVFGDGTPSTQAHLTLNLSPFPGGELLARFTYADSVDTAADSRTRLVSPSLRWTVRPGLFLDVAYTDIRTRAAVEASRIQTASANLTITL